MNPISLKINNFLSHKNSELDFTRFNVALILGQYDGNTDVSNGSGKCLGEDTVLTHAITGEKITVKELYETQRQDFYVSGLDEDLKLRPSKVIATQKSGIKNLLKITMNDGSEEIVSDTHPIMTGFLETTQAKDLKIGSFVAQPRKMNYSIVKDKTNLIISKQLFGKYLCGPKKQRFKNLYNKVIGLVSNPNIDIIPNSITYPLICDTPGITNRKYIIGVMSKKQLRIHNLSREKCNRYFDVVKNQKLKLLVESDLLWSKIKNIEEAGYGETYDIQIDNKTSLYALDGFITHNSSILSAISYALFNVGRGRRKDDIIKKGENNCSVEFVFEVEGTDYKIVRKRDKNIKQSSVVLYQFNGEEFVNISSDTNILTDQKISELIRFNYDVFTNSVYFKQGDIDLFVNATPAKRKEVLRSVLNLDRWEDYYKKARDNHKQLHEKVSELNKQIIQVGSIDMEIAEKKNRLFDIEKELASLDVEYVSYNDLLMKKEAKFYAEIGNIDEKINNLKNEKQKVINKKNNIISTINKLQKTFDDNTEELLKYEEKLKVVREKIKLKDGIDIRGLEEKLLLGKTKAAVLKNKLTELEKDLILGEECILCFNKIHEDHIPQIKARRAEETIKVKTEYEDLTTKLKNATNIVQQKKNKIELANNAVLEKGRIELIINKLQNSITTAKNELERNNKELEELPNTDFDQEILQLNALIDETAAKENKKEITTIKKNIVEINIKKDTLNVETGVINANIIEISNKKQAQQKLIETIHQLNHDLVVYDKLKYVFSKDGIQSVIIESIVGDLEYYTNDMLAKICNEPTHVAIKMTKVSDTGNVSDTFDIEVSRSGEIDDLEMLSGGEKFRVSLALRLALSKILAKKIGGVVKFLLLDEVSSSLDSKGVSTFVNIIKQLSGEFKILLISHDENVKEHFDDIIVVHKDSNGSRIVQ